MQVVIEFIIPKIIIIWNMEFGIINSITSCILLVFVLSHTAMHGSMNIKFINAKQTIDIHAYKINFEIINSITSCILLVFLPS